MEVMYTTFDLVLLKQAIHPSQAFSTLAAGYSQVESFAAFKVNETARLRKPKV